VAKTEPFEKQSDRNDEWFEKNRDIYLVEIEAIRRLIPFPEAKGLEVGVGSGKFAASLGIKTDVEPAEKMAVKAEKLGIRVFRDGFGKGAFFVIKGVKSSSPLLMFDCRSESCAE